MVGCGVFGVPKLNPDIFILVNLKISLFQQMRDFEVCRKGVEVC